MLGLKISKVRHPDNNRYLTDVINVVVKLKFLIQKRFFNLTQFHIIIFMISDDDYKFYMYIYIFFGRL